jgi:uncharacterized membrane protein (UPF0136 family)
MKPGYWIAIFALAGGIIGYAVFRSSGWLGTVIGIIIGILIGALVYAQQARKTK